MSDIPAHDDAVSCLSLVGKSGLLVSGSWDCSVKYFHSHFKYAISFNLVCVYL